MATAAIRREKNIVRPNHQRTYLTPTGLLMEGDTANYDPGKPGWQLV